jgi:hypothetical protein
MFRFSIMSLLLITTGLAASLLVFTANSLLATSAGVLLYIVVVLSLAAYAGRAQNTNDEESRRAREADESNPTT